MRDLTLNFPLYNDVTSLVIALDEDAQVLPGDEYTHKKPVVYLGSSITQGGCASRPGNTYESIVSQRMNIDHVNLGFSGSGKGEKIMAGYIAKLDMSAFVMDYDHNSPSVEHLTETHYDFYKTIRNTNPTLPIIIMSKSDFSAGYPTNVSRRSVIFDTYRKAVLEGDKKVYFIDGESVFRGPYENVCTVDGTHPNDMGFALMADAVEYTLKKAFAEVENNTVYML
jgi:hypothetical protein